MCRKSFAVVVFRLQARLAYRSLAIDLVSTLVNAVPEADSEFGYAIATAFGEAFNKIVLDAYRDHSDGMLDVEAELGADYLALRLMHHGVPLDLSMAGTPDLDSLSESRLGVFLIHAFVDEVVYQSGTPNILRLTKRTTRA